MAAGEPRVRLRLVVHDEKGRSRVRDYSIEDVLSVLGGGLAARGGSTAQFRVKSVNVENSGGGETLITVEVAGGNGLDDIAERLRSGSLSREDFERLWQTAVQVSQPVEVRLAGGGEVKIGRLKLRVSKDTLEVVVEEER